MGLCVWYAPFSESQVGTGCQGVLFALLIRQHFNRTHRWIVYHHALSKNQGKTTRQWMVLAVPNMWP